MISIKSLTPVVVIGGKLGGLSICRTLGKYNIDVHVFDEDPMCPAFLSRYCKTKKILNFDQEKPEEYLAHLISFGKRIRKNPILIPTSDELSIFVSEYDSVLRKYFRFPENNSDLIKSLRRELGLGDSDDDGPQGDRDRVSYV
jgi:predicted ATP-grasp superfamily ATP-dependent carboligase